MEQMARRRALVGVMCVAIAAFYLGIKWGLPSRAVDPFLFGDEPVWTGEQIDRLAPAEDDAARAADVDANPLSDRTRPIWLNETEAQRAEIIRRYRLFSYQPDEMITFKSLSKIRQNHGDPRLYQYGGLWIYPVGILLKAASMLGLVDVRADRIYYLDHPEAFGRFYIVARAYAALWGVIGTAAVFWIVGRMTRGAVAPAIAAVCFIAMPVVVTMGHEAKPHLPGAVLTLLAVVAATKYVETGNRRLALIAGALCGTAMGMVLTGGLAFSILFPMFFLRRDDGGKRWKTFVLALAMGALVYVITNPFVLWNLIAHPGMLGSNVGNTTQMYRLGGPTASLRNATSLLLEGTSPLLAIGGAVGGWFLIRQLIRRDRTQPFPTRAAAGLILLAPAVCTIVPFVLLAAGKPGEYGRFALIPDIALCIAAIVGASRMYWRLRPIVLVLLLATTLLTGVKYLAAFVADTRPETSRLRAAQAIDEQPISPSGQLLLLSEPAPYCTPPVNLFRRKLILLPRGETPVPGTDAYAVWVTEGVNRLSWANKEFKVGGAAPAPAAATADR